MLPSLFPNEKNITISYSNKVEAIKKVVEKESVPNFHLIRLSEF